METKTVVLKHWDDLVFENRNKEYGAYYIRQSYSENVSKAFLIAISSAVLVVFTSYGLSKLNGNDIVNIKDMPPFNKMSEIVIVSEKKKTEAKKIIHHEKQTSLIPKPTTEAVPDAEQIDKPAEPTSSNNDGEVGEPDLLGNENGTGGPTFVEPEPPKKEVPVTYASKMPEFKGGLEAMSKFLRKNLVYPGTARRMGVDGTVYISFVIDKNGKVILAEIVKGISKECDEEAKRVISKMPDWLPGKQNNREVMVRMVLPIKFHLEV